MKRWILPATATTAAELTMEEMPVPEPGMGQVRVRVAAISINARDLMILAGPFGRLEGRDLVPLSDIAGRVDALGEGVTEWTIGDRVTTAHVPSWADGAPPAFGPGPGSLDDPGVAAELVVVDAARLVAAPATLDDVEASSLQIAGVTAWNALFGARPVVAGDTVVVIGSGGVALFATQLAQAVGASVYAAVLRGADDPRWAALGVAGTVTIEDGAWGEPMHALTGGASKVVNTVGPGVTNECLAALGGGGEVSVMGLRDFAPQPLDAMAMIGSQLSVRGVAVGSVTMHRDLSAFVAKHDIHPVIDRSLTFEQLPEAYDALATSGVFGKIVITPTETSPPAAATPGALP